MLRTQLHQDQQRESEHLIIQLREQFRVEKDHSGRKLAYAEALSRSKRKGRRVKGLRLFKELVESKHYAVSLDSQSRFDLHFLFAKALYHNGEYAKCLAKLNQLLTPQGSNPLVLTFITLLFEDHSDSILRGRAHHDRARWRSLSPTSTFKASIAALLPTASSQLSPTATLLPVQEPSSTFPSVVIDDTLAQSHRGLVLLATQAHDGTKVVIKEISFPDAENTSLETVEWEFWYLTRCAHPNLVSYLNLSRRGEHTVWMMVEYSDCGSLESLMQRLPHGALSITQMAAFLPPVLRALEYLHGMDITHANLKPSNVLIDHHGVIKLSDYALSRHLPVLPTSATAGSHYMAPESVFGRDHIPASDLWSLGILILRCLEGRLPYHALSSVQVLYHILYHPPPELSAPALYPDELHSFLHACLQTEPACRASASDLLTHPLIHSTSAILKLVSPTATTSTSTPNPATTAAVAAIAALTAVASAPPAAAATATTTTTINESTQISQSSLRISN